MKPPSLLIKGRAGIVKKIVEFKADGLSGYNADLLLACVYVDPVGAELEIMHADRHLFSLRTKSLTGQSHVTYVPSEKGWKTLMEVES